MLITKKALELISSALESNRGKFGDGAIPVIIWVTDNSGIKDFRPHITLGVYTNENPQGLKATFCDGLQTDVLSAIPCDVIDSNSTNIIDVLDGRLILNSDKNIK